MYIKLLLLSLAISTSLATYAYRVSDVSGSNQGSLTVQRYSWVDRDHVFAWRYDTQGRKMFIFSPEHNAWAAYDENGWRVRTGIASGGADYCRDVGRRCRTPEGVFTVYREGNKWCASSKYPLRNKRGGRGGAPMPYCMHFFRGYAIHGSNDVPDDYHASHGCIRVDTPAAVWLNLNFIEKGTKVWVLPYPDA